MKTINDLFMFAEELIEYALLSGDEETATIIEEAVDGAHDAMSIDTQLAEILLGLVSVEERVNVPDYPVESVIMLRTTLRGMNNNRRFIC